MASFWERADLYMSGAVQRETLMSAAGAPVAGATSKFLAEYPFEEILRHVSQALEAEFGGHNEEEDEEEMSESPSETSSENGCDGDDDNFGGGGSGDIGRSSIDAGQAPELSRSSAGLALLARLAASAWLPRIECADGARCKALFAAVRSAAEGSQLPRLRRVAASFLLHLARRDWADAPTAGEATSAAPALATASAALWEPVQLACLCSLAAAADTVASDRAQKALTAMCAGGGDVPSLAAAVATSLCNSGAAPDGSAPSGVRIVRAAALVAEACRRDGGSGALVADAFAGAGVLSAISAAALDNSDPLTQIVLLETLPSLASVPSGQRAILSSGLPSALLAWSGIAEGMCTDEVDSTLSGAALTALGDMYAEAVVSCAEAGSGGLAAELRSALVPGIFYAAARNCAARGELAAVAVAACAAVLAADPAALDIFLTPALQLAAREWLEEGCATDGAMRAAALGGVATVLEGAPAALARMDASAGATSNTGAGAAPWKRYEDLFDRLGAACGMATSELALACLRKPDMPARLAAYKLLAAAVAAGGAWGARRVWGDANLTARLLDAAAEPDPLSREAALSVARATLGATEAAATVDAALLQRLHARVRGGPHALQHVAAPRLAPPE